MSDQVPTLNEYALSKLPTAMKEWREQFGAYTWSEKPGSIPDRERNFSDEIQPLGGGAYIGETLDNQMDGKGIEFECASEGDEGELYEGWYLDNRRHGHGREFQTGENGEGLNMYVGEMSND